jgi:hypothetical protein
LKLALNKVSNPVDPKHTSPPNAATSSPLLRRKKLDMNSHRTQGSDDDPAAYENLKHLAECLGNEVLSLTKEGDEIKIVIKKK